MAVKIGHASKNENSKARGGKAGDQTQREVFVTDWYNGGWLVVLRPVESGLAERSAKACEAACKNDRIGYDQSTRNSLYELARKNGFDLEHISTPCNCDCSSLMHVCAMAGGANLSYGTNAFVTSTMAAKLENTGDYKRLTGSEYTRSAALLKRGDILVSNGHTVMVLGNGSGIEQNESPSGGVELVGSKNAASGGSWLLVLAAVLIIVMVIGFGGALLIMGD